MNIGVDTTRVQERINAVKRQLAELDGKYVYAPIAHRGEPVDYTDTWTNIVTDLRDAGQDDLADRVENMRRDGDA